MLSDSGADAAYAFLRANTKADMRFDEHFRPLRYVIAPDGRIVSPVMVAMLESVDTVLFIPECIEEAMEVQVTLEEFTERGRLGSLADRWRIYHGDPEDVRWALMSIDGARHEGLVIDGDVLMHPNPFADAGAEAAICWHMNEDHREDLRRIVHRFGNVEIESPVMVGIDPLGIDIRARFDVFRVPATEEMKTREDARRVLAQMSEEARGAE